MLRFIFTFIVLFIFWLGLTTSLATSELVAGAIASLIIATFSYKWFTRDGMKLLHPLRIVYAIQYLFVFILELIKSNFDVAARVINPKLPISPGIVEIKTKLKNPMAIMILANSITLTPGTLTIDVLEDRLYIHWLVVSESDPDKRFEAIAGKFEPILEKIFS